MDTMTPPIQPSLTPKQLKALAKAERKFYQKKRFWVPVIGLLVIVGIAAAGGGSSPVNHPAANDVAITSCGSDSVGFAKVGVTITNHSTGQSNYLISVNVLDAAGNKIGEADGASNNIASGQSSTESLTGSLNGTPARCVVGNVTRLASN